jgi:hypothetical protein
MGNGLCIIVWERGEQATRIAREAFSETLNATNRKSSEGVKESNSDGRGGTRPSRIQGRPYNHGRARCHPRREFVHTLSVTDRAAVVVAIPTTYIDA